MNTVEGGRIIFEQAQHDEQAHAHTLNAMGHLMENAKSTYYIMHHVRDHILPSCGLIHELTGDIYIQETFESEPVRMRRLQPFQAHKTLGYFLTINGQSKRQFLVFKTMIKEWAAKVS